MLSILPILLATVLVVAFSMGAMLVWRYTERNRLQKTLVGVLVLWVLMFLGLEINLIRVYDGQHIPTSGTLNFHNIVLGLIGQFSLLSYAVVAIHPRLLLLKNSLLFLSPVLTTLVVYIVWHFATGIPINYRYLTISELWEARWTAPVMLRMLMLLFFCIYLFIMLRNVWMLVPIYNKYSEGVYSDIAYNVKWLRVVVIATGAICVAYTIVLIWNCSLPLILYTIVTCVCLMMLIDNAVFHKVFQEPEGFKVVWSFREEWHEVMVEEKRMSTVNQGIVRDESIEDIESALERWMIEEKPYHNPEFSFSNVVDKFPALDYHTLSGMMERRNHTFQSYVRHHRIVEACRLMQQPESRIRAKEISSQVGFGRYTSFNRAFLAVMNESPSQYRDRIAHNR